MKTLILLLAFSSTCFAFKMPSSVKGIGEIEAARKEAAEANKPLAILYSMRHLKPK